jgi:hypothetical protein
MAWSLTSLAETYHLYFQYKKTKIMRKLLLTALIVVIAAAAHAQTDTTVTSTTAVIIKGKAYLRTITTTTNFQEVTGETIIKNKREKSDTQEEKELERLTKRKTEKQTAQRELNKLIKQALANDSLNIEAKTEEELAEIQKLRSEVKKEKVKPIK